MPEAEPDRHRRRQQLAPPPATTGARGSTHPGRGGSAPAELSPLGRAVDTARRERGWTLLQLAARLGVSRQHLYRVLRGRAVPAESLRARLEQVLGIALPPASRDDR